MHNVKSFHAKCSVLPLCARKNLFLPQTGIIRRAQSIWVRIMQCLSFSQFMQIYLINNITAFCSNVSFHLLHSGGYDKEEKAARAYDLAALKYWGTTTTTNFQVKQFIFFFK
jgi:hypothetical protein